MLIAPLLLAFSSQTQAAPATSLADLVPSGTVAFVQSPSLERAAACVGRLAAAFEPAQAPKMDAAMLMAMSEIPGDAATVDTARPVGVCLVMPEGASSPLPVFLVPVRDAAAYTKSVEQPNSPMKVVAKGGYACVGLGQPPELPSAPAAIAKGLLPGELSVRIDLARLIEQFHDSIDEGLNEVESASAGAGAAVAGLDTSKMMGAYVEFLRDAVDSMETLDLGLSLDGDDVELGFALVNSEGSTLASFGSKEKTGLRALAPLLDMDSGMSMLMGMDGADLMKHFMPLFESLPAAYPEPFRPAMQALFSRMNELYGFMGTAQAGSMDFTETGIRYRLYSRGGDPAKLLQAYRSIAGSLPGCSATDVAQREVAGVKVDGALFKIDPAMFTKLAGEKDKPDAKAPELEKMMAKLFGKDGLLIQAASKDGTGLVVIGGDDAYLNASLARISGKGAQPAFLGRALTQVGDLNPCMIVRYDLGRMMAGMKDIMAELMPGEVAAIPSLALATTFWGGVDGRVWRGALELNLAEIAALKPKTEAQPASPK